MTVARPPTPAIAGLLDRLDALADETIAGWRVPGVAYGLVSDGRLVHARGVGTLRVGEAAVPDADSVFRIASMTKSFTAATVLALRDAGRLGLDDAVARWVPELSGLRGPTADSPPITIRHLLTMTAGFPTDDPWGDRQQGLDLASFAELLAKPLSFAWTPGTRFEYSNLGYGILGRVITNVAGREYREVVGELLLEPLGMASTTYLETEVPPARLARGYVWRDDAYLEEPMDGYGALAAMGGIFTTVRDLSRWVGWFADAFPPRDEPDAGRPLSRAARREMQQPMVDAGTRVTTSSAVALPELERIGYGFGLFSVVDLEFGRIVGHGGGYPGFGSHMRWHPASGLGVIVLANGRYAPARSLADRLLPELIRAESPRIRRPQPGAATEAAARDVEQLLDSWDDDVATRLLAMNVDLDEPLERRRRHFVEIRDRHGRLSRDRGAPVESQSPFQRAWWLTGERGGRVRVEILLTPESPPRVQTLSVLSVGEPSAAMRDAARQVVQMLDDAAAAPWAGLPVPAALPLGPLVDRELLQRSLVALAARGGPVTLGPAVAGDGASKATFRVDVGGAAVDLAIELASDGGTVTALTLSPLRREPPNLE